LLTLWLRELTTLVEKLTFHWRADFRLWLTTDLTDRFPAALLQRAMKLISEAPSDLQLNMK
jgi:hypothetical protein